MAEDSAKSLTPPLIDIADAKIRSLTREFRDRRFWMERRFKRYPLFGLVSKWEVARGLTTLAAACGVAVGTYIFTDRLPHNLPQSQTTEITEPEKTTISTLPSESQIIKTVSETNLLHDETDLKNDLERQERTLQWKKMIEEIVTDPRLDIPLEDRNFWTNRMLQIIFVESGGNPKASSGIAFGLTQLRLDTADEIAKKYKIPKYDLRNGWDNIFLGLTHQLQMTQLYGKDLAPWVHHLGMGNMTQAIITYLISVEKLPISEINMIFFDETNSLLPKYIQKYQIDPEKLLKSPAVTARLKQIGAFEDDTQFYDVRLKAAGRAMNLPQTKA